MRALGIDFGERRIGLALSDPEGRWAMPLHALARETDRRAVYQIADLVRHERVDVLVIGEPCYPDGAETDLVHRVRRFGARLERVVRLPVVWVGEALTTIEATERLAEIGLDDGEDSGRRDAVAAQILLQEAIDRGLVTQLVETQDGETRS